MPTREELTAAAERREEEMLGAPFADPTWKEAQRIAARQAMRDASGNDAELRLKCLAEANATAKMGLSHDVYQTADKYYRWAMGEKIEAVVELPFKVALIAMIEAELREERSDIDKIREEMSEAFGIVEDRHWPQTSAEVDRNTRYTDEEVAAMGLEIDRAATRADWPQKAPSPEDQAIIEDAAGRFAKAAVVAADYEEKRLSDEEFMEGVQWAAGGLDEIDRRLRETEDRIVQPIVDSLRGGMDEPTKAAWADIGRSLAEEQKRTGVPPL